RRSARHYAPEQGPRGPVAPMPPAGEDAPPWADLPPVRPPRHGADSSDAEELASVPDDDAPRGRSRAAIGARARRALLRKRRRSFVAIGGAVVVIAVVLIVVFVTRGGNQTAVIPNDFITTFQPGELQQVPNACEVIPAATMQQYLPGKVKQAAAVPVNGKLGSTCNWTLDHQPVYRLLEVSMQAYAPFGLASGNGSATNAATDSYTQTLQGLQDPPKHSVNAGATVTMLSGMGNEAFSAMQVFHVGGAVSDEATVMIRFHNVIVTVELSGLEHSNKGHYGPVDKAQLSSAALAFAQAAYASLKLSGG
ncbi:MAG TPA: hypothetical protein VF070_07035, partial [Streptosporangiaceae bacterium]